MIITEQSVRIANTIKDQISIGVYMRIGARRFYALDAGLEFRVGPGRANRYVQIALNAWDLYDVQVFRVTRNGSRIVEAALEDMPFDQLNPWLMDNADR